PDMLRVIQVSREVFQLTGGAFDPTVAPLVNLWGFGPDPALDKVPPKSSINHQLARVGLNKLSVDDDAGNARRTREIQLDLSAVAKGYAVDVVADMLTARGLTNYLVEVGGELRISGHKAGQKSWRIAIESPEENRHEVQQALTPGDAGIATSGDYRNYFERDGKRYSHTIDPRTGYPVTHQLASVTVIAERTAYADAMATALMVMGQREALALAEKNDLAVYLLVKEGDGFKSYASPAFVPYLSGE
ncbi:MAG: FAD:protein FMN transferase, partial [Gammaproteobacteria bacterium]